MKHTLLIALLGATVTLATPTLSYADNGYKFQSKGLDRNHQYKHKHGHKHHHNKVKKNKNRHNKNKNRQFVFDRNGYDRQGYNKHGYNRHGYNRQGFNKHGYNKHGYNRYGYNRHGYNRHGFNKHGYNKHGYDKHRKHRNDSFSITWNVGNSTISYGNDHYGYNNGYKNNHHKKYRGKKIYKRLNNQANRIQNGINNGKLVHREVKKLRHEQRDIKNTLSYYKRDGHLNRYERNKLNQMLDVASHNIQRKISNHRTRYTQQHNKHYDHYTYHVQF